MSQQQQQRQKERGQERTREESRHESSSQRQTADQSALQEAGGAQQRRSDMALEEAQITEGKDGARNLQAQWINVALPSADSCRFAITTAAGHAIEAVMEQKNYRRSYQGTSSLQTDIVPVAPDGTKGKLTVHDMATGETLERPWTWHAGAGGLLSSLWQLLKQLFT
jgi:hypothetical protein